MPDLKLYWETRRILRVSLWRELTCSTSLLDHGATDMCELPCTAVKFTKLKHKGDSRKCVGYLGKLMTHAAPTEHTHINPEKHCQRSCSPQQHRLVWAWWMADFYWQSIMSCQYIAGKKICPFQIALCNGAVQRGDSELSVEERGGGQ